ncbi:hypothetical protein IEQ34_022107 [Dendrobium chrysotoxum]|uniref:NIF system FeS cluster assembly NifU N-terminal domain-containing protein n=1 Tax=Dendrobium chrysotoxum TaxID=161865 RepID=A0AAV7FY10_DENCH|nr:hypothetical protein IEQ34_022107 [Dendrobium chrysotoxum]
MDQSARKRAHSGDADNEEANLTKIPAASSSETEDDGDDMLERLLKWFDEETRSGSICISSYLPDSVTINGNEEMCGSSFSAAAATVMAGIDTKSAMGMMLSAMPYFYGCSSAPPEMLKIAAAVEEDLISAGQRKVGESVQEWVARVLNE